MSCCGQQEGNVTSRSIDDRRVRRRGCHWALLRERKDSRPLTIRVTATVTRTARNPSLEQGYNDSRPVREAIRSLLASESYSPTSGRVGETCCLGVTVTVG